MSLLLLLVFLPPQAGQDAEEEGRPTGGSGAGTQCAALPTHCQVTYSPTLSSPALPTFGRQLRFELGEICSDMMDLKREKLRLEPGNPQVIKKVI